MKVILAGFYGHMGREVKAIIDKSDEDEILMGADIACEQDDEFCKNDFDKINASGADCIIDFSHHTSTKSLLSFAVKNKLPVVLATTGHTKDELDEIYAAAKEIPVFYSANMSFGVALLGELVKKTVGALPDAEIEVVEIHHDRKVDAPSGTAKMLVDGICSVKNDAYPVMGRSGNAKREKNEIGVHSLRLGNVVGVHEVIVSTGTETISIKHEAHSRALFADGAVKAAHFLCGKKPGIYTMKELLAE